MELSSVTEKHSHVYRPIQDQNNNDFNPQHNQPYSTQFSQHTGRFK